MKKKSVATIDELRSQIVKAKMEMATRKLKNTNFIKNLRRDLARTLTAKRQEELYAKS